MAKKQDHTRRATSEAANFVAGLKNESIKGGAFDSAAATEFVDNALDRAGSVKVPETLQAVFDEADDKQKRMITRAILDGAANYEKMHGTDAPGDLLEQAMHLAYGTTRVAAKKLALDSATSDNHDALSLQPNRAVVAILSTLSEAIPFAHYLPADLQSNEARLAIMTHQAGSTYGAYKQGGLMDGVSSGDRYISTSREHMCEIVLDTGGVPTGAITGKLTAIQDTDSTCDPAAAAVPLLRGRSIVYVNGRVAATEISTSGSGNSSVSGQIEVAGTVHQIGGTINTDTGVIELTATPALPEGNEVLVEGFIDYERDDKLTPRVITDVEVFSLYAKPWRVITTQSIDARTQMSNELGLDPYSEGVIAIQGQFANERHYDVLRKAKRLSAGNQETFDFAWATRGDYKTRADVMRDLSSVLGKLSQKMANDTMNHGITHLYVGDLIGAIMQGLPLDIWQPSGVSERPGIYRLGRLFGKYDVYYAPKVVMEAVDGSAAEIICVGQATDVTRNPFVLGDAVAPTVIPLSTGTDLKSGAGFYARNFTAVNPHNPSSKACARINVTNLI
jgi:hypothetical protein